MINKIFMIFINFLLLVLLALMVYYLLLGFVFHSPIHIYIFLIYFCSNLKINPSNPSNPSNKIMRSILLLFVYFLFMVLSHLDFFVKPYYLGYYLGCYLLLGLSSNTKRLILLFYYNNINLFLFSSFIFCFLNVI